MNEGTTQPAFSAEQSRTLAAALDEVIPPSDDGRLPGAGEIVTAQLVERAGEVGPALAGGLAALDALARERGAQDFAALPRAERAGVLRALEPAEPAFVSTLLFLACTGYYQEPRVVAALGLEARPPHPKGYTLEAGDLSGLERVRARGPQYRDC